MSSIILMNVGVLSICLGLLWVVSVVKTDASIIDPFWSIGFLVVSITTIVQVDYLSTEQMIVLAVLGIWALRLFLHLFIRQIGKPEDHRYQAFRHRYGGHRYWWISLFHVFALQGVLIVIIGIPLMFLFANTTTSLTMSFLYMGGMLLSIVGIIIEAMADWQLTQFRKQNVTQNTAQKNDKVLDSGLWGYSRHPNYFGDAVTWWGFGFMAVAICQQWWLLYSPMVMTLLLLKVSGVVLLEKTLVKSKPKYRDYINNTSAFVLMPKKNEKSRKA